MYVLLFGHRSVASFLVFLLIVPVVTFLARPLWCLVIHLARYLLFLLLDVLPVWCSRPSHYVLAFVCLLSLGF